MRLSDYIAVNYLVVSVDDADIAAIEYIPGTIEIHPNDPWDAYMKDYEFSESELWLTIAWSNSTVKLWTIGRSPVRRISSYPLMITGTKDMMVRIVAPDLIEPGLELWEVTNSVRERQEGSYATGFDYSMDAVFKGRTSDKTKGGPPASR